MRRKKRRKGRRTKAGRWKQEVREKLLGLQKGKCFYCKCSLRIEGSRNACNFATLDHVVPLSKGGTSDLSNLVLACRDCNKAKGSELWTITRPTPIIGLIEQHRKEQEEGILMPSWRDTTSYRRGQEDRTPTCWSLEAGSLRVVVTCGHIHYPPGTWVMNLSPLWNMPRQLKATNAEEARAEAIGIARKILEEAEDALFNAEEPEER